MRASSKCPLPANIFTIWLCPFLVSHEMHAFLPTNRENRGADLWLSTLLQCAYLWTVFIPPFVRCNSINDIIMSMHDCANDMYFVLHMSAVMMLSMMRESILYSILYFYTLPHFYSVKCLLHDIKIVPSAQHQWGRTDLQTIVVSAKIYSWTQEKRYIDMDSEGWIDFLSFSYSMFENILG